MKVRFRRLDGRVTLPSYAHEGDAGMDVRSNEETLVLPGDRAVVRTGLAAELPEGYELQVRPRSGLASRCGVTVVNAPGTIDAGYRGEICVCLVNLGSEAYRCAVGDRIAQLVAAPVVRAEIEEAGELSESERGACGFGSTGVR